MNNKINWVCYFQLQLQKEIFNVLCRYTIDISIHFILVRKRLNKIYQLLILYAGHKEKVNQISWLFYARWMYCCTHICIDIT